MDEKKDESKRFLYKIRPDLLSKSSLKRFIRFRERLKPKDSNAIEIIEE